MDALYNGLTEAGEARAKLHLAHMELSRPRSELHMPINDDSGEMMTFVTWRIRDMLNLRRNAVGNNDSEVWDGL